MIKDDTSAEVGPDASALLQLKGIVKTFPGVRALDGVDLEVVAGEVHCLLGQNGAWASSVRTERASRP
jgi:ribose transport system ATP-binding protein